MSASPLLALDRDHLIHPVMNLRSHERDGAVILESGHGAWLRDLDGREYLDGFAGLWCVNAGYGQASIVRAATQQMERLPYATAYFGYSSEPAIRLATELVARAPASLRHVYFTLGGSDAIDSAIRYITSYFNAIGQPQRKHFIALERAYHGSSALGAGLSALRPYHINFDLPQANQHHLPSHYPYRNPVGDDPKAIIAASVSALASAVSRLGADRVAAFCCEPVQGAGGVIVPPEGWLSAMSSACRQLGILMIVDEVITAFGRTGPLFACDSEGVQPDVLTVAKGLTSGYAPMGAVLLSDAIYQGIADGVPAGVPIGHGYTYSAHPVSAAVGLAVLRLYEEGGLLANGAAITPRFAHGLDRLRGHPLVGDARHRGLLGALELVADRGTRHRFESSLRLSERVARAARENGVIFRAFADDILGFAPPLCCTSSEIDELFVRVERVLDHVLAQPEVRSALA